MQLVPYHSLLSRECGPSSQEVQLKVSQKVG